jgi:hypothetical protein
MPGAANVGHTSVIEEDDAPKADHADAKKVNLEKLTT